MAAQRGRNGQPFDLILLEDVSNKAIVENLKSHHSAQEMYSYIGPVLISVNPYTNISGLYSTSTLNKYVGKKPFENPPHVFAVAEAAYRRMCLNHSEEAVVITGESGAGKTENAKQVMNFVAAMVPPHGKSSKETQRIKTQLLESNPLLECFGNAKTVRNDNSSRFGKLMSILFKYGEPTGGKIQVYLLEKARVVHQLANERNFHAFYQLLRGADGSTKGRLQLTNAEDFRYTKTTTTIKGVDDARDFQETCAAMNMLQISEEDQRDVWRLVAAILHMGNITFTDGPNGSSKAQGSAIPAAAQQLGLSPPSIEKMLTTRDIVSGRDSVTKVLDAENAGHARDSLAKTLYGRLFLYLVARANEAIFADEYASSIGVLDIFGFEILGSNGFEQLCINFTNERLHALFISQTLKGEQNLYAAEGIPWEKVDFYDNLPVVEMIEKNGGMFALINEESIFPKGTDLTLFSKLKNNLKAKEFLLPPRGGPSEFQIKHYAGVVKYDTTDMLAKNRDDFPVSLVRELATSSNGVCKHIFSTELERINAESTRMTSGKRPDTACVQYKKSVLALMADLEKTSLHYIRCIKPNENKSPAQFVDDMVNTQSLYLGLLENVKVRRAGYSFRMPYELFVAKYKCVTPGHEGFSGDFKAAAVKILKAAGVSDYQQGKSQIFIKSPKSVFALEDKKKDFLDEAASYLPPGDGLIAADKVFGLSASYAPRSPLMMVVGGEGVYFFTLRNGEGDGGAAAHYFPHDQIEAFDYNTNQGWISLQTKNYPGKFEDDPPVRLTFTVENTGEPESWAEILKTSMGKEFDLRAGNGSAPTVDGQQYKQEFERIGQGAARPPERGRGNKAGGGGGGCCVVS